jgi:hypothetical protein
MPARLRGSPALGSVERKAKPRAVASEWGSAIRPVPPQTGMLRLSGISKPATTLVADITTPGQLRAVGHGAVSRSTGPGSWARSAEQGLQVCCRNRLSGPGAQPNG